MNKIASKENGARKISAILIVIAMMTVGISLTVDNTVSAEFVNYVPTPWASSFVPTDSAWDSSGNNCVVVGEDASGIQSSAWYYDGVSWSIITEGTDANSPPSNTVVNQNTSITYGSIQAAIDAASPGNILSVWAGVYNENIAVGIPITLIGNGSANTIIDGCGASNVVEISVDGVSFSGFNVTNSSFLPGSAGIMLLSADNCEIHNNTISGNTNGIYLQGSSNNLITENDIKANGIGLNASYRPERKMLVGATTYGGYTNGGTMFEMDPSGSDYNIMHDFQYEYDEGRNPYYGAVTEDIFDLYTLYGVTTNGGLNDKGIIYQTDKDGLTYSILHQFEGIVVGDNPAIGGDSPSGTLLQIGNILYGVTLHGGDHNYGTIYKINTDGSDFTILHDFGSFASDGREPYCGLIYDGISFYGTTYLGGTNGMGSIYKMNPDGSGFTILHSFTNGVTGYYPRCELMLDGTTLYGTSCYGGAGGDGVIYSIETDGSMITVIHSFIGGFGDGENPFGGVVTDGMNLYGVTIDGGTNNLGVVYSINMGGGPITLLHSFTGSATWDGSDPYGKMVFAGGRLYGMTRLGDDGGAANNDGIIFSTDTVDGSTYTILHGFIFADGYNPYGSLIYDGTDFFGATYGGGNGGVGTVFKFEEGIGMYTIIHSFDAVLASDGHTPYGDVIQVGTSLYGTTYLGGTSNSGTIYKTNLDGSGHTVLHHFAGGANGNNPYTGVVQAGTALYGTTYYGGASGVGTIYKVNMDGTGFIVIHNFTGGVDGSYPRGALTWDAVGGFLYGMSYAGGTSNYGTVYKIDNVNGASYTIMHTFTGFPGLDGDNPYGSLMDDGAFLYGMARDGGSADMGIIFKIAKTVPYTVTILHNFTGGALDGQDPYGGLVSDGTYLYGMTYYGGTSNHGVIFRMMKDGSGFGIMHEFNYNVDVGWSYGSLILDEASLYGMARYGGPGILIDGGVFKISTASEFTALHYFEDYPTDGAQPYYSTPTMVVHPAMPSESNLIYHNNFIGNSQRAWDEIPLGNSWSNGYPDGGNYWSDYGGADWMSGPLQSFPPSDGIGDMGHSIPGGMTSDSYPWMREDGWKLPYSKFTSVAWDEVNERFWLTCEVSTDALSTLYYVDNATCTKMVPIAAPPISFTAVAADDLGNVLIGGNDLDQMFYYNHSQNNGWPVTEIGTDKMWGWNITAITFNPNDDRFYVVGNIMNQDKGVAFYTDQIPLDSGFANCYKDASNFMNSPGPGGLKAIEWNPTTNYALVVGDGVYRVNAYDGNPGYELSWATVGTPEAGISYYDVSWDSDGWNEAGISGDDNTFGSYWRYYHSNPILQDGFTNGTGGTTYSTCAMKPPSSPKWLLVLGASGGLQVNIGELDQSTDVSASTINPNIFWAGFNDTGMTSFNNQPVNPDSWFNIVFEGNYSGGWNSLRADITVWYDDGWTGTNSQYPTETVTNRNKAFNLTYEPAGLPPYRINYPIAPALEFTIGAVSDTITWNHPFDATQSFHRVVLSVHLGAQMFAADGNGFAPAGPDYHSDPNVALNNPNSWDFNITLVDVGDDTKSNSTYGEFGVNRAISIGIAGSPNAEVTPGSNGVYLGSSTITYSTNTQYWVNVSIPHLYLNGEDGHPQYIPAGNLQVQNTNSQASGFSDIAASQYFSGPGAEFCVWGLTALAMPLNPVANGTTTHGPWGSNYNYYDNPTGTTNVDWFIDMPGGIGAGTYRATISYTIETNG